MPSQSRSAEDEDSVGAGRDSGVALRWAGSRGIAIAAVCRRARSVTCRGSVGAMRRCCLLSAEGVRGDDRVGLIDGVRKGRRGIAHLAILHRDGHLLRVRKLLAGSAGVKLASIGHEGGGIHHAGAGHVIRVPHVREAIAGMVGDGSGLVHPGAHDGRSSGREPI